MSLKPAMTSEEETYVRPGFSMPEDFFTRCLTNENIHYDVNENLCPNPPYRVDKNIEVQGGTFQLTFYCRPTVVCSITMMYECVEPQ